MNRRLAKYVLLGAAAVLLLLVGRPRAADDVAAQKIDERVAKLYGGSEQVARIAKPAKVLAYRIDPLAKPAEGKSLDGYATVAGPVTVQEPAAREISTLLLRADSYDWESAKLCDFMPGVVLRFHAAGDDEPVDVLICFDCDQVEVFHAGKRMGAEDVDAIRAALLAHAKAIFPHDKALADVPAQR